MQGFLTFVEDFPVEDFPVCCACINTSYVDPPPPSNSKDFRRLRSDVGGLGKGVTHFGFHVQRAELGVQHLLLPERTSGNPNLGCAYIKDIDKPVLYHKVLYFYHATRYDATQYDTAVECGAQCTMRYIIL